MATTTLPQKPVCITMPDRSDLEKITNVLNSQPKTPVAIELRKLIQAWQESGPNLKEMLHADQELWGALYFNRRLVWLLTKTGRSHFALFPGGSSIKRVPGEEMSAVDIARTFFFSLTLNPEWDKLAGPCPRCDGYYLRKTSHEKIYCTHRCASAASAIRSRGKKLKEERTDKLIRASKAICAWNPARAKHWKDWVCKNQPDITAKWLTRAVNKGALKAPAKR